MKVPSFFHVHFLKSLAICRCGSVQNLQDSCLPGIGEALLSGVVSCCVVCAGTVSVTSVLESFTFFVSFVLLDDSVCILFSDDLRRFSVFYIHFFFSRGKGSALGAVTLIERVGIVRESVHFSFSRGEAAALGTATVI